MTPDPLTCRPDDDLVRVIATMESNQVRRIPVVDGERRLVGMISQADIALRGGSPDKTAEVVQEISKRAA